MGFEGRIGADDGARPEPSDDGFAFVLGVKMTDFVVGLLAHPLAVIADIGSQAGGGLPIFLAHLSALFGVDWALIGETRRDVDHGFVDHDGDRVEVGCVGLQSESLGFEGDATAAGEGVEQGRRLVICGDADELAGGIHGWLVGGVFPCDESFDEVEESHARGVAVGFDVVGGRQVVAGGDEVGLGLGVVGVIDE